MVAKEAAHGVLDNVFVTVAKLFFRYCLLYFCLFWTNQCSMRAKRTHVRGLVAKECSRLEGRLPEVVRESRVGRVSLQPFLYHAACCHPHFPSRRSSSRSVLLAFSDWHGPKPFHRPLPLDISLREPITM